MRQLMFGTGLLGLGSAEEKKTIANELARVAKEGEFRDVAAIMVPESAEQKFFYREVRERFREILVDGPRLNSFGATLRTNGLTFERHADLTGHEFQRHRGVVVNGVFDQVGKDGKAVSGNILFLLRPLDNEDDHFVVVADTTKMLQPHVVAARLAERFARVPGARFVVLTKSLRRKTEDPIVFHTAVKLALAGSWVDFPGSELFDEPNRTRLTEDVMNQFVEGNTVLSQEDVTRLQGLVRSAPRTAIASYAMGFQPHDTARYMADQLFRDQRVIPKPGTPSYRRALYRSIDSDYKYGGFAEVMINIFGAGGPYFLVPKPSDEFLDDIPVPWRPGTK